jgi:RNA polymerase sigma-70 factor (ECF subfamily)
MVRSLKKDISKNNRANKLLFDFESIVADYQDKVLNICYSYTNNIPDAEDIAQNVFIELYQSLNKFQYKSSLSTWIYRIASNKSIDFLRNTKRQKRGGGQITYLDDENNWGSNTVDADSADCELIQQQRKELLYKGLERLPTRQREAFVLTQIEGLDYKETADVLQTSVKSVESLVVRGKKKLKLVLIKHLKEYL